MERGLIALKAYRKAWGQNRLPVLDSDTLSPFWLEMPAAPVLDSNTLKHENGGFQPKCIVRDSNTHIATTIGSGARSCPIGWWEPNWTSHLANKLFATRLADLAHGCELCSKFLPIIG